MSSIETVVEKFKSSQRFAIGRFCELRKLVYYGSGHFERVLALKTPLPQERENKDILRSLEVEAALLSRISHPNIVSVIDFSRERDIGGIVMEFITGVDLKRLSDQQPVFPPEMLLELASKIIWALSSIHRLTDVGGRQMQIIHRDLTLQNIMITEWGEVKIIDFGSATSTEFSQPASEFLFRGRLNYLAPEYLMGQTTDYRLDYFSLGIMLYRLATGHQPFVGEDRNDLVEQMTKKNLEAPSKRNRKLGKREDEIILKCLHPNPAKRLADPGELLDMIRQAMRKREMVSQPGMLMSLVKQLNA